MPIVLSKRLSTIVSLIPECSSLADIGTDHAFIPIHTVESQRVTRAIATDLRSGPLDKARENVAAHGLRDVIDLRLGDGLSPLEVGEVDAIISAGIGGHVHATMLLERPDIAKSAKWLVFQPMNAGHVLRQTLDEHHYRIIAEKLVEDDGRIYEILVATSQGESEDEYDRFRDNPTLMRLAYTYGPRMMTTPPSLFQTRLSREVDKRRRVLAEVGQSTAPESAVRQNELNKEIEEIQMLKQTGRE